MEVTAVSYEDLNETERTGLSNNGCGKEYATYIKVTHEGNLVLLESDAMEPEDATFGRDLNWILQAIREAYQMGLDSNAH